MADYLNTVRMLLGKANAKHFEVTGNSLRLNSRKDANNERPLEDVYEDFADVHDGLPAGAHYKIVFWANDNGKKAAQSYTFYKPHHPQGMGGIGSIDMDMQTRLHQMERRLEMQEMEARHRDELRKVREDADNSMSMDKVTNLLGHIGSVLEKAAPLMKQASRAAAAPAIASPGPAQVTSPAAPDAESQAGNESLGRSIEALIEVLGPEHLVSTMELLAKAALANPADFRNKLTLLPSFL